MTKTEYEILHKYGKIRRKKNTKLKITNFIFGAAYMAIAILLFVLVGCLDDELSITTFLKWESFIRAIFLLGLLMYKFIEVDKWLT